MTKLSTLACLLLLSVWYNGSLLQAHNRYHSNQKGKVLIDRKSNIDIQYATQEESDNNSPITELPDNAVSQSYTVSGTGWVTVWGFSFENEYEDLAAHIAVTPENDAYIFNPFSGVNTNTYLKGRVDGDKITVTLPQLIHMEDYGDGVVSRFYAMRLLHEEGDPEDPEDPGIFYPDPDNQTLEYIREGDSYVLDLSNTGSELLGMIYYDFAGDPAWGGSAEYNVKYEIFTDKLVEAPMDLETETWAYSDAFGNGRFTEVGFYGDKVYMKGFSEFHPDSWIMGNVNGNMISFPSGQYVGIDHLSNIYNFFMGADGIVDRDPESGIEIPNLELTPTSDFEYDSEKKFMTTASVPIINANKEYIYYLEAFPDPVIKYQPEEISYIPLKPFIQRYEEYNPDYLQGSIVFEIYPLNEDSYVLNSKNLYYRLIINGEPMIFSPDQYSALETATTDIPASFDSFDFYMNGNVHTVTLFNEDIESIGVQSVYKYNGEEYLSEICNYTESSIKREFSDSKIIMVRYYDITGKETTKDAKGFMVKHILYENGKNKTVKYMNH